uniref:Secreted protein n=1 Tax=Seriola dumerili TaxID=41447 RepID=A0A3B4TR18_SERDU
ISLTALFSFHLILTVCATETKRQYFPQVRPTKNRIYFACVITLRRGVCCLLSAVQSLSHSQTQDRNISPWIRYGYVCLLDSKRPVFR